MMSDVQIITLSLSLNDIPNDANAFKKWIAKSIRRLTQRTDKAPCYICGQHKLITELHHLTPVGEMAEYLAYAVLSQKPQYEIRIATVWLCPNHHAIWHLMSKANQGCETDYDDILSALSLREQGQYQRLSAEKEHHLWGISSHNGSISHG